MTTSRHLASPLRSRRRVATDRIISTGLAVTACAGIVGVIGVRSIEESAATQQSASAEGDATTTPVVSSAGLTEAQLDEYSAQLQAEATQLDAYRAKLSKVAHRLTVQATTRRATTSNAAPRATTTPAPRPARVAKPVAKPAPKPARAAKPQSHTKSS